MSAALGFHSIISEEQNLLSHASRGNAASVKLELEPSKHLGKSSWRDGVNTRDSDRDNTSRGKHLRDDLRDDSIGSLRRGRGGKDLAASSRHPEFSRSMTSDNWREAKKRDSEMDVDVGVSWSRRQEYTRSVKSWRDPPERDEPRGGHSHRESHSRDSVHYDRGDYRLNPMWTSPAWTLMLSSLLQVCLVMMTASSTLSSHKQTEDLPRQSA